MQANEPTGDDLSQDKVEGQKSPLSIQGQMLEMGTTR